MSEVSQSAKEEDVRRDTAIQTLTLLMPQLPDVFDITEYRMKIESIFPHPSPFGEAFWSKSNKERMPELINALIERIREEGYPAYKEFLNIFEADAHSYARAYIEGDCSTTDIEQKRSDFIAVRQIFLHNFPYILKDHLDTICLEMRTCMRESDCEVLRKCTTVHREMGHEFINALWWSGDGWLQALIKGLEEAETVHRDYSYLREITTEIRKLDENEEDLKKASKKLSIDDTEGHHEEHYAEGGSAATGSLRDIPPINRPPLPTPEERGIQFGKNILSEPSPHTTTERRDGRPTLPNHLPGIIKDDDVVLRNYQLELLEYARYGYNTIITAPTGTGKTMIAIYLIKNHIKVRQNAKVIFLAPSRELVEQQFSKIKKYINPDTMVIATGLKDQGEAYTEEMIRSSTVTVMTPQILENILNRNQNLMEELTLLVFDECHHTIKKHSFNRVMGLYRKMKITQKKEIQMPQVVGLSALLGFGNPKTIETAVHSILEICANIDCEIISVVSKNQRELDEHSAIATEESFIVTCAESDKFKDVTKLLIDNTEKLLMHFLKRSDPSKKLYPYAYTMPKHSDLKQYATWAVHLRTQSLFLFDTSPDLYTLFNICSRFLEAYVNMLILHDDVGASYAIGMFQRFIAGLWPEGLDNIMKLDAKGLKNVTVNLTQLFKLYEAKLVAFAANPDNVNKRLEKLKNLILEAANGDDQELRAMVFMRTRVSTEAMLEWMNVTDGLKQLNPERIVGQRSSDQEMSSAGQNNIMERFANGTHKILIATSVVEEGIDVPACNIVFRYNYITSAVGRIQQKGRVRRHEGKSVTLLDSRANAVRDQLNLIQVAFYKSAVEIVLAMDTEYYKWKIKQLQEFELKKMNIIDEIARLTMVKTSKHQYDIHCMKCTKFMFSSTNVRTIETVHRVIIGDDFENRIFETPHHNSKPLSLWVQRRKKIYCATRMCACSTPTCECKNKCGNDLGIKVLYYKRLFPVVKLENLVVIHSKECSHCRDNPSAGIPDLFPCRKWKQVPFQQLPLEIDDFASVDSEDEEEDDNALVFMNIHPAASENDNINENTFQ